MASSLRGYTCKTQKICVVGAGIIGLSTAVKLQEELGSSAEVTVIAEKFGRETTSDAAAGGWRVSEELTVTGYTGRRTDPTRLVHVEGKRPRSI